jgi:hypothetical protein
MVSEESVKMEAYHTEALGRMTLELQVAEQGKRLWLENGALHRMLVRQPTRLRVLRGTAWITHDGKDIVLQPGQKVQLDASQEGTLVGALGDVPLVFDVR